MSTPSRCYLAVWLRRLATDRIARRSSAPAEALVIAASVKGALRLCAVNDAAAAMRLRAGMPLADARAMYPTIAVADADPAGDLALLEAVADWCDRYTPLVGLDAPDGLLLDITGCAHLFGGEAALCRDVTARLAAHGFATRAAIAGTVGCAWGVARCGKSEIVASGKEKEALAPLPLAALRLSTDVLDALAQVGLKRIADVLDRPRAPLAARFGETFVRRIDQALGRLDEPIMPRLPVPVAMAEQRFASPIALTADMLGTIEKLAGRLATTLERRGEGARLLQAALFRTDGKVFRIEVGTAEPLREPARIRRLFNDRLDVIGDECDPGFGFDVVRLGALVTERREPAQTGLAAPDHEAELAHLIDRLGARFGQRRVTRIVPQDTHIPEYAALAVGAAGAAGAAFYPPPAKRWGGSANAAGASRGKGRPSTPDPSPPFASLMGGGVQQDSLSPIRPIRLFEQPELITAIAEVPDHAPRRFQWRGMWHEVVRAEGPERIATEWWRDRSGLVLMRDYFRVESREGLRVWIYRSWPRPKTQEETERESNQKEEWHLGEKIDQPTLWFLHGVFA